jgi:hypothetical protein
MPLLFLAVKEALLFEKRSKNLCAWGSPRGGLALQRPL